MHTFVIEQTINRKQNNKLIFQITNFLHKENLTNQTNKMQNHNKNDINNKNVQVLSLLQAPNVEDVKFTNLKGLSIKIYKDYETFNSKQDKTEQTEDMENKTIVCILAIPSYFSLSQFMNFIKDYTAHIKSIKLLKQENLQKYTALLNFKANEKAKEFIMENSNKKYTSFGCEKCVSFLVDKIVFVGFGFDKHQLIVDCKDVIVSDKTPDFFKESNKVELPTCPVCLERMESKASGIISTLCNHTFHCHCLKKWSNLSCPVCRYTQKQLLDQENKPKHKTCLCSVCGVEEDVWTCLICGKTGCGRYNNGHAHMHYKHSGHIYSLEIATQRVWDYVGDKYVHRLLQSSIDGKIVEIENCVSATSSIAEGTSKNQENNKKDNEEVVDHTTMLITQLDSQRLYYEERLEEVLNKLQTQENKMIKYETIINRLEVCKMDMEQEIKEIKAHNGILLSINEKTMEKYKTNKKELEEEKQINLGVCKNIQNLKDKIKQLEAENFALNDQNKDLLFYLSANDHVKKNPELQNGNLELRSKK